MSAKKPSKKSAKKSLKTPAKKMGRKLDALEYGSQLAALFERLEPLAEDIVRHQDPKPMAAEPDPFGLKPTMQHYWQKLLQNPQRFMDLQMELWQDWMVLWQESTKKFMGEEGATLYVPDKSDRRFRDPAWQESAIFDFIKQSYLLTSQWMQKVVRQTEGLTDKEKAKMDFFTRQFVDAMAPNNFVLTNPEVLRETIDSNGKNLLRGLENLMEDIERGNGTLSISKTNYEAFEVGRNLAVTPGKVVFENALMQLIQYEPQTKKVQSSPLLIVPPWINKYYILDMRPDNSYVRWAVEQGFTVFMISWVNPDKTLADKTFDSYVNEGLFAALDVVEAVTGSKKTNVVGYCIGGTLLTIGLALLKADKKLDRIASATFLTTLINFENAGDLSIFVDDEQIAALEKHMKDKGFLEAGALQNAFSMLRSNDLIWSFVVNNYLMGKEPFQFDLLYWNDDSTNMPGPMHSFYLKNMYRDNKLCKPGGIKINNKAIDVSSIDVPAYFLSTKEDHIAPWKATYEGVKLFSGPRTFTLAASGHVAGVVNAPVANKYSYWTAKEITGKAPATPDEWYEKAQSNTGSWWQHWAAWLKERSGPLVDARRPGDTPGYKAIENAPGRYVKRHYRDTLE